MINSTNTVQTFKTIVYLGLPKQILMDAYDLYQAYIEERFAFYDDKDANLVCSELTRSILETKDCKICVNEKTGVVFIGSLDEPLDATLQLSNHNDLEPYITCPKCLKSGFIEDFIVTHDEESELILKCATLFCEEIIMKF